MRIPRNPGNPAGRTSSTAAVVQIGTISNTTNLHRLDKHMVNKFPKGSDLYRRVLEDALKDGILDKQAKILVLCAGGRDKTVFELLGFENVTISNLSQNLKSDEYAPYHSRVVDAESMECADDEYDFCVVHAGLHHCQSPPKAILEMLRVGRRGLILVEPCDSMFTRLACKLGFSQNYEILSVLGKEGFKGGGMRFGGIPNYVYRFTAREVEKTVETYAPYARHQYLVKLRLQVDFGCYTHHKNPVYRVVGGLARPFLAIAGIFPFFANNIAVAVIRPDLDKELFPWLQRDGGEIELNSKWVLEHFNTEGKTSHL